MCLLISRPCVLVSLLIPQGNMTRLKVLVDHHETLVRQFAREKKKNMFNGFLINKPQFLQEKRKKEMTEIWCFVNQFHVFDTFVTCT